MFENFTFFFASCIYSRWVQGFVEHPIGVCVRRSLFTKLSKSTLESNIKILITIILLSTKTKEIMVPWLRSLADIESQLLTSMHVCHPSLLALSKQANWGDKVSFLNKKAKIHNDENFEDHLILNFWVSATLLFSKNSQSSGYPTTYQEYSLNDLFRPTSCVQKHRCRLRLGAINFL